MPRVRQITDFRELIHSIAIQNRDQKIQNSDCSHNKNTGSNSQLHHETICRKPRMSIPASNLCPSWNGVWNGVKMTPGTYQKISSHYQLTRKNADKIFVCKSDLKS